MLEGTLGSFAIPDILHLLTATRKSGTLRVSGDGQVTELALRDGELVAALPPAGRPTILHRLVSSGSLSLQRLSEAVAAAREKGEPGLLGIVAELRRAGAVDAARLTEARSEQARDVLFDLLRLRDGRFVFEDGVPTVDEPGQSLDLVMADAAQRLATWESLRDDLPSPDTVVHVARAVSDSVSLSPAEWRVIAFIDGQRTLAEIVRLLGDGEFQTGSVVHELLRRGLIERSASGQPTAAAVDALLADAIRTHEVPLAPAAVARDDFLPEAPRAVATPVQVEQDIEVTTVTTLRTDPEIDEELVERLIDGVKNL